MCSVWASAQRLCTLLERTSEHPGLPQQPSLVVQSWQRRAEAWSILCLQSRARVLLCHLRTCLLVFNHGRDTPQELRWSSESLPCSSFFHLPLPKGSEDAPHMACFMCPFKETLSGQREPPTGPGPVMLKRQGSERSKQWVVQTSCSHDPVSTHLGK